MTHRRPEPPRVPSQVAHPWRATARTVVLTALAILPLLPEIARAAGIETVPAVASVLTIAAAIQRVILIPEIDDYLDRLRAGAHPPTDRTKK